MIINLVFFSSVFRNVPHAECFGTSIKRVKNRARILRGRLQRPLRAYLYAGRVTSRLWWKINRSIVGVSELLCSI